MPQCGVTALHAERGSAPGARCVLEGSSRAQCGRQEVLGDRSGCPCENPVPSEPVLGPVTLSAVHPWLSELGLLLPR